MHGLKVISICVPIKDLELKNKGKVNNRAQGSVIERFEIYRWQEKLAVVSNNLLMMEDRAGSSRLLANLITLELLTNLMEIKPMDIDEKWLEFQGASLADQRGNKLNTF